MGHLPPAWVRPWRPFLDSDVNLVPPPEGDEHRLRGFALVSVLVALLLTMLLQALFQTVLNTALPKIITSLQGLDRYTWVVTAYPLAMAVTIPVAGKLSDQFGRRRFLLAGIVLFTLGSILGGLSQSMDQLIASRTVQGVGAGLAMTLVMIVLGDLFTPKERGRWQGLFGATFTVSSIVGPSLGGWLTDHGPLIAGFVEDDTRWRWAFFIIPPLGALAFAAIVVYLPAHLSKPSSTVVGKSALQRIDFAGMFLLGGATISLLLGMTWGGEAWHGWRSPEVIIALVLAVVLAIGFLFAERLASEPLIPLALFKNPTFAVDSVIAVVIGASMLTVTVYMPLYLQAVLGQSATNAGAAITPMTVSFITGSMLCGYTVSRLGRYKPMMIASSVVMLTGALLLATMTRETSVPRSIVNMVVVGLGIGMFFPMLTLVAQNALPREFLGTGTATVTYFRSLGQVLGVAMVGLIVSLTLTKRLGGAVPADIRHLPPEPLGAAILNGFWMLVVLGVVLLVCTVWLKDNPLLNRRGGVPVSS